MKAAKPFLLVTADCCLCALTSVLLIYPRNRSICNLSSLLLNHKPHETN